jgi:GT2 family glycosyltransferase
MRRPAALARCLAALRAGTDSPAEVLVVDQAPTPEARAVVARSGFPVVRYLEQPPLGLSASRNLALAEASSPVLAVTDDDCAPDPGWVAALAAALDREPRPVAVSGPILPLGPPQPGLYAFSLRESAVEVDHAGRMLPWDAGSGANFAARIAVLRAHGGWDPRLGAGSAGRAGEDADLLYRLLRGGGAVRYEPDAVVRHEWQTRERRVATRWSYAYGVGALCGLWLRRRDPYAVTMLTAYARMHLVALVSAGRRGDHGLVGEHGRALAALPAGLLYGVRAPRLELTG